MAVYTMYPVIKIRILKDELKNQFDIEVHNLRYILFNDNYQNDCCKYYSFVEDEEYTGEFWQDEEHIRIRNLVNAYLRDILPDYECVLIDVSW